jgi:O-antigen/teichoic acid export membrane protein
VGGRSPGGREALARRVGAGLVDQVVIALAGAGNSLLGLLLLPDRDRAGGLVLSLAVGYVVLSLNRAFVGEVLLALTARLAPQRRDRLVRDGFAAALAFGLAAAGLLAVAWALFAPGRPLALPDRLDLRDLGWVAVVVPVLFLHDTARYSYLADRRPQRALGIDLTFVAVQGVAVLGLVATDLVTPAGLVLSWGLGALAGYTVFVLRTRHLPWSGDPRRWLTQTRFLSGWFTAVAVVGQLHTLAVTFLIGAMVSKAAVAGFRFVQVTVLQPAQNFNQALMSMIVPRLSGLAGEGAAVRLRRDVTRIALVLAGLAAVFVAVGGALTQWLIPLVPRYADTAPIAWPILIQAGVYMVQTPFTAALRGMHRPRLQFVQYVAFSAVSVTGLVLGATLHGLLGAVWGLAVGATVGLALTIGFYSVAVRAPVADAPDPEVSTSSV